ncbi:MAG: LLM class flavin-dependent oxidoreductase, partial [Actinomycetia bacterium]|nr:LLM class flavin-dependent oxidoreductase [Actinomycetes bacterium]
MTVQVGVNLMAQHWVESEPVLSGRALLQHRARLFRRMSDAGIDHVMVGDHVMFHGGVGNDGLTDAASVVTAAAHLDIDLDVYLAVYLMVLRHPVPVARQILTVAQLAPGRLSIGLGVAGDDRREVEACGVDPRTRGRRMDEALGLVRRLLDGERVTHTGEFFTLDDAALRPVPERPVPLIVGGRSAAAVRRAGRLGDGWLGIWNSSARCATVIGEVEQHAVEAGRRDVAWRHGMTVWCGFGPDAAQARARVAPAMEGFYRTPFEKFERYVPHGTPAEVADFLAPYLDAGITTINLIPFAGGPVAGIDAAAEVRSLLTSSTALRV